MGRDTVSVDWSRLSEHLAAAMGLHFPRERWSDLERGLAGAAREFGYDEVAACVDWLLEAPLSRAQQRVLAGHLTIGETYFFRERRTFEVLTNDVLPALIHGRRGRAPRLRLWSAGCCTGEEAYSLAILLHQVLPDLADWQVTILATDLNPHFLRKAAAATYGNWSFRDTPPEFRERYFERSEDDRYTVVPEIRKMVTFAPLNLVDDVYPSLATDTNAMDLIFCRNVLMYFTPAQAAKAVDQLRLSLSEGGWLAVSPSETSPLLSTRLTTRNFPGVILYQKRPREKATAPAPAAAPLPSVEETRAWFRAAAAVPAPEPLPPARPAPEPLAPAPAVHPAQALAESLYHDGRYAEAADALLAAAARAPEPRAMALLARALANQGRLADALGWVERWIAADKLDAAAHYLRAVILLEQGETVGARGALQRAVYLAPDFVVAHFSLGNLARGHGRPGEAEKHFHNAAQLLARLAPDEALPESDGLTAGRLTEMIAALTTMEKAR